MAVKKSENEFDDEFGSEFDHEMDFREHLKSTIKMENSVRHVNPLGMRVLVRVRKEEDQTEAGLYLPEGAKEEKQESVIAEVLEVASAIDDETHEEANISGIPEGALVLIEKDIGIRTPWDDALRIVETQDVLAIITEIDLS